MDVHNMENIHDTLLNGKKQVKYNIYMYVCIYMHAYICACMCVYMYIYIHHLSIHALYTERGHSEQNCICVCMFIQ